MKIEHQVNALFFGPRNVVVKPCPAARLPLARALWILERNVVQVKSNCIHAKIFDASVVNFRMVLAWVRDIQPHLIAKCDAAQNYLFAVAVNNPLPRDSQHCGRRWRGRRWRGRRRYVQRCGGRRSGLLCELFAIHHATEPDHCRKYE